MKFFLSNNSLENLGLTNSQSMSKIALLALLILLGVFKVTLTAPAVCTTYVKALDVEGEEYLNSLSLLEEDEIQDVTPTSLPDLEAQKVNTEKLMNQYKSYLDYYTQRLATFTVDSENLWKAKVSLEQQLQNLKNSLNSILAQKASTLGILRNYQSIVARYSSLSRFSLTYRNLVLTYSRYVAIYNQKYQDLLRNEAMLNAQINQKNQEILQATNNFNSKKNLVLQYTSVVGIIKARFESYVKTLADLVKAIEDHKIKQKLLTPEQIIKETELKMIENRKQEGCKDREVCEYNCKDFMKSCPPNSVGFMAFEGQQTYEQKLAYDWVCKNDAFAGLNEETNHLSEIWQMMAEEISGFTRKQFEDDLSKSRLNPYHYDSLFNQWLQSKIPQTDRKLSVLALYEYKIGLKGFFRICKAEPTWRSTIDQKLKQFDEFSQKTDGSNGVEADLASKAFKTINQIKTSFPDYYKVFITLKDDYQKRFIEMIKKEKDEREYCQCKDFRRYYGFMKENIAYVRRQYGVTADLSTIEENEKSALSVIESICQKNHQCVPYTRCSKCEEGSFCTEYGCFYPYLFGMDMKPDHPSGLVLPSYYQNHPIIFDDTGIFTFKVAIRQFVDFFFPENDSHNSPAYSLRITAFKSEVEINLKKRYSYSDVSEKTCKINFANEEDQIIKLGRYQQFYVLLSKGVVKISAGDPDNQKPLCSIFFEDKTKEIFPRIFRTTLWINRESFGWIRVFSDLQDLGISGTMCSENGFKLKKDDGVEICQCDKGYSGKSCEIADGPFKPSNITTETLIAKTTFETIEFEMKGSLKLEFLEDVPDANRKIQVELCSSSGSSITIQGSKQSLSIPSNLCSNTIFNKFWVKGTKSFVYFGNASGVIYQVASNILPKRVKLIPNPTDSVSEIKNIH
jgi:hypothetical protein